MIEITREMIKAGEDALYDGDRDPRSTLFDTEAAVVAVFRAMSGGRVERMEEALERIVWWADAYPLHIFIEPDDAYFAKAHEVLTANGMTLDTISASIMRHVIRGVGRIARDALGDALGDAKR